MKVLHYVFVVTFFLFMSCEAELGVSTAVPSDTTTQGSYANMIVVDDFMYVINNENLQTFSLEDAQEPKLVNKEFLGFNIESLLHYDGSLFIGSPQAMYIFEIDEEGIPRSTSITDYAQFGQDFCQRDPIAVNENHAYASLSSLLIGECRSEDRNEIRVFDITNMASPRQINVEEMESPRGIALDGDLLFICEAENGLKVMDVSDPLNFELLYHFEGFKTFDVIAKDGLLVVVGPTKIYEYDYSNIDNMTYLSEIDF